MNFASEIDGNIHLCIITNEQWFICSYATQQSQTDEMSNHFVSNSHRTLRLINKQPGRETLVSIWIKHGRSWFVNQNQNGIAAGTAAWDRHRTNTTYLHASKRTAWKYTIELRKGSDRCMRTEISAGKKRTELERKRKIYLLILFLSKNLAWAEQRMMMPRIVIVRRWKNENKKKEEDRKKGFAPLIISLRCAINGNRPGVIGCRHASSQPKDMG